MAALPTVVTSAGMIPLAPVSIRDQLLASVSALSPGYTYNLPGILIEDILSTDVAAIVLCDSARIEAVDSLTPAGANDYLLNQIGQQAGISPSPSSLTTVYVVFFGPVGYVVPIGLEVGDGAGFEDGDGGSSYFVADGGAIGADGQSEPLFCQAADAGSWQIAPNTVIHIATTLPAGITLTCTNPQAGNPGTDAETSASYRARCLQAQRASAIGMPTYLRTLLANVQGVQQRLISVQSVQGGGWKVIVGGGDPYDVAYAIFQGLTDISQLQPSQMTVAWITNATNAIVATAMNHGLSNGMVARIDGITDGMTQINGLPLTVTVIDEKTFSTGVNSLGFVPYTTGGIVTPNPRNNVPVILDYPDSYAVPFISPPLQTVDIAILWNTPLTNRVSDAAVATLAAPAVARYINSIYAGQPINVYDLEDAFRNAVASVLAPNMITRLVFSVSINGVSTLAAPGTGIIVGDPESYLYTDPAGSQVSVSRG